MLMEYLIARCRELKAMVTSSFLISIALFNIYFTMVPAGAGSEVHYFIIFYGISFFLAGPGSRVSSETIELVEKDPTEKMVISSVSLLARRPSTSMVLGTSWRGT